MDDKEIWQRVTERIEELRPQMTDVLCRMIRIPSVNLTIAGDESEKYRGKEGEVNEYLESLMKTMGLETDMWAEERGRTNLVGHFSGGGAGRSLMFNGHVDVVHPGDAALWTVCGPFDGIVKDGRIYGRGASDMKGGIAASLFALKAVLSAGFIPAGDVFLEYVVGEEMMEHMLGTTSAVNRGYRADGAVVCEPTAPPHRLAVEPACCNVGYLVISVPGKATHACMRGAMTRAGGPGEALGVSAIDKAMLIYEGLRRLDERWGWTKKHELYENGHFNIHPGVINSGNCGAFAVSDECRIECSVWAPPQEKEADIKAEVEQMVEAVCNTDPWLKEHRPQMFWPAFWPSYNMPVTHPLCAAASEATEKVLGEKAFIHGFVGSDDASFLTIGGTPALTLGPGSLMAAHAPDEYTEIEDLMDSTKIYASLIMRWCGGICVC